jgi:hypothetical protein
MARIGFKKKLLFCFILLTSFVFLIEFFSFVAFYIIEKQLFSFSRIYAEQTRLSNETDILKLVSAEEAYDFLTNLGSADILTENADYVKVANSEFTINNDPRGVLYEHPNSEVVFKDLYINKNPELQFGVGIDQDAWNKSGDGVLFEVIIVDDKSHKNVIFSRYVDPKNNLEDRKWLDISLSLVDFAGQKVSFIFKTTGGPKGDISYDWAGWSSPQLISKGDKKIVANDKPIVTGFQVIHPYLGFVYNPEYNNPEYKIEERTKYSRNDEVQSSNIPISEYGFVDKSGPFHTKSNDRVILGIFGGSVAFWFSVQGIDSLINELRKSPMLSDKEIVVVRVAMGGYKQPQQLIALSYLLSLGAQFDIIINIDGFNEVALPPAENIPKNVFPFYPRNWFMMVQGLPDPVIQYTLGEITYIRSRRSKWAMLFSKTPFRYSVTLNLIWKFYDHNLAMAISRNELILQSYKPKENSYVATGPSYDYQSNSNMFKDLAYVWKRSSIQMHRLCKANGIRYFHFLQPNQYIAGSKIMREEELKQAFLDGHPYKKGVEGGYPYLIKAGKELVNEGLNFYDLTMIFSDIVEPIYVDTCCHFNKEGNEILGTFIGQAIVQDIEKENADKSN